MLFHCAVMYKLEKCSSKNDGRNVKFYLKHIFIEKCNKAAYKAKIK